MVSLISKIQPEYGIDFEHFVELQQSPLPLCIFYLWQIIQVIVTIIFPYYDIFRAKNDNDRQNEIPTIAYLSLLIFIPIGLHIYHWIHTHHPSLRVLSPSCSSSDLDINNLINQKEKTNHLHVYQIGNIFIVLLVLISSTMLLSISISSSINHTTCHLLLCLEMTSSHSLQPYLVFQNVFHAIIPPVIIKAHSSWCAYLIFFISLISSFLSAIIVNESPHIYVALITFYILGGIVVYDNEITLHYLYENYMKHEENLVLRLHDNTEKQLLLLKEEELRYLFGNVAHDLKSPLHGFSLELETLSKHPVVSDNQQFMDSIIDLSNICSFMLMTINRALDYSKASTGMVLIPSLEKVNIKEILKWVIRCASPTTELPIKVEPFPESMSFNIETDRYWLMENLLCLVSNAQKFTTVGTILIRCRLIEINEDTRDGSASSGSP
jgi:signal transduction histidine kinase